MGEAEKMTVEFFILFSFAGPAHNKFDPFSFSFSRMLT
jgi:hypothetical protein